MNTFPALGRLVATGALVLAASCASVTPGPDRAHHEQDLSTAPAVADLGAKFRIPNRERGRRDRAAMNAKYFLELEADERGTPSAAQIFRAHEQRDAIERATALVTRPKAAGLQPSRWQALGPSNIGGRVRAIAFDPRSPNRVLAGAASGGIWVSDNAGDSWRANSDFLPNLSITTIVFDPVAPSNAYMGTGEASAGLVGVGAFKSVDGGETWQYLAATNVDSNSDWRFVNRLAAHPAQSGVLLAALTNNDFASGAIYRTQDGGNTWSKVSGFRALDIAYDPNNPANAVAGLDDGTIAFSRDAGATWARTAPLVASPSGRGNTARAEIAFARSQAGVVYASVDNAKGEVWRSNDSGGTWQKLSTPAHLNLQGDYDNTIWVDPTDANHVIVGGLDLYQSKDGGASFTKISEWRATPDSPHADHHAAVSPPDFGPGRRRFFNGNDGGIYRAANIDNVQLDTGWTPANNGLAVTQFYSGAGSSAAGGRVIGGTQDNGSLQLSASNWRAFRGGDGGYVAVDPVSDITFYGSYVYLAIHRSLNGGVSSYICNGITEALPNEEGSTYCGASNVRKANFISPFIIDPNNRDRLLAGANSLWVTSSARSTPVEWTAIKEPSPATDNFINAIAVHEGNGNVIWVGHNNGEVYRTANGLSTTPAWTRVGLGQIPGRRVQRILVDRENPNRAIVALTGFVPNNLWQTTDGGFNWSSITGNLPAAPIFDVKRHPVNASWLYAATSVGVFTSEDGGAHWSTTNEGPANIRVRELFWIDDHTLGAATYGRGMFKVDVASGGPPNYQDLWWAGNAENGWGMSLTQHNGQIFGAFYIYDAQGRPTWAVLPGGTWGPNFTSFSGALYSPTGTWFGAYDASRLVAGASIGNATITFTSASTATLSYTINGVSGQKSIERQLFGPVDTTPVATYGDLWWGGESQNGWGVAINQQYRTLFSIWYTYDQSGRTIWYVIPGGTWTATDTFTGTAFRTTGSAWLGVPYNPNLLVGTPVGTVTFKFTGRDNAIMSYTIDGVTQSKPIARQPF